jgi:Sap, sulfolipid-1-addressing protein
VAHILLLAAAAAVYPPLLAGVILILSRRRPLRLLVSFLMGGMIVSVGLGVAIVRALGSSAGVGGSNHTVKPIVDIAVGAASLAVAWAIWRGHTPSFLQRRRERVSAAGPSFTDRALGHESMAVAFAAGVVLSLPGGWYLAALTDIAAADVSIGKQFAQIVLFNVVMFTFVEVPLVLFIFDPARAQRLASATSAWIRGHARAIGAGVTTMVGVWLLAKGIVAAV